MTNQQVYDKVKKHLLGQMKRCAEENNYCLYRGRGKELKGLRCAIGCLIPNSRYRVGLENLSADQEAVLEAAGLRADQDQLARRLQSVHDSIAPRGWRRGLAEVARHFGLKA